MIENEPSSTAPLPAEAGSASLRRGVRRLGARVREEMQQALEQLFDEAARLAGSEDPATRAAGETVARAAEEIAARLSRFEEPALEILAAEAAGSDPEAPRAEAGSAGEQTDETTPPSQLTRALAGELTQLARHTDTPLDAGEADVLRPRIRRAARLANLWLTTSVRVGPPTDVPESAGTTSTYGPRPTPVPTTPPSTATPPSAPAPPTPATRTAATTTTEGTPVAVVALTDRLGRLQHAYGELQERSTSRERYWREAIHELRNAAHAFMSWGFVLRRSELKDTPWFAPLVRAAEAVLRRAEEALSAERAEDPMFAIRTSAVDLVLLAREALESIRPAADARNLTLAAAAPTGGVAVLALADPDRVLQIVHNLLRNAVDATPPGGSICITVGRDAQSPFIEVEDSGPGVADDIFETLPTSGRTSKGFGVGLRLSRELAQRMAGSLGTAPAVPGGGARFVLRLPEAPP